MVSQIKEKYNWCVIGSGPAAVTALAKLLDRGIRGDNILWIADHFNLGDFGTKWSEVPANTSVGIFREYLQNSDYFQYRDFPDTLKIKQAPENSFFTLGHIAEPLKFVVKRLRQEIPSMTAKVSELNESNGLWQIRFQANNKNRQSVLSQKVILATGSTPIEQPSALSRISLYDALTPSTLEKLNLSGKTVAVFGGSHSAILAVMNLMHLGASVINVYKHPLKYAKVLPEGILFDNTGLKGEVASWSKATLHGQNARCTRIYYQDPELSERLKTCDYVIDAIGFNPRKIAINGTFPDHCPHTGIIAHRVYGLGIAYPEKITGIAGNEEWNVGLKKFALFLDKVLPIWLSS